MAVLTDVRCQREFRGEGTAATVRRPPPRTGKVCVVPTRIRPAVVHERAALEALQRRASLNNPGDRAALLAHPDAIFLPEDQIARGEVILAEDDDQLLGFAAILDREDGETELDGLFVEPAFWQHGIGRELVLASVALARARGSRWLHVVGNLHAEGFYTRCGFERVCGIDTRFGPALSMRLWLGDEHPP